MKKTPTSLLNHTAPKTCWKPPFVFSRHYKVCTYIKKHASRKHMEASALSRCIHYTLSICILLAQNYIKLAQNAVCLARNSYN